jgi:hypothetical protein
MQSRRTYLLVVLVLLAGVCAVLSASRMARLRDSAAARAGDLAFCEQRLADLSAWTARSGGAAAQSLDGEELGRRIREAAGSAGVGDKLSVEPAGAAARVGDSDYTELSVILRGEPLTLREVTSFLHALAAEDPAWRPRSIDLHVPASAAPADAWRAEVTVGYLLYQPRRRANE